MANLLRRRIPGLFLMGAMIIASDGALADGCSDFSTMRNVIVDMTYDGRMDYVSPIRGASVAYVGPDGALVYDRYDLGLDHISRQTLDEAFRQTSYDLQIGIKMLNAEILDVMQPKEKWIAGDVAMLQFSIVAASSADFFVGFVAMGTDGHCLHKVHYTPSMDNVNGEGINREGLFFIDRFHRALDGLAPYFEAPN